MEEKLKYSVTVCGEELAPSAPVLLRGPLEKQLDMAAELGYDAIELQLRNPEKLDVTAVAESCRCRGLAVSAVATGLEYTLNRLSMIDDDAAVRRKMMAVLRQHIDVAAELDSQIIIGCVRGNIPSRAEKSVYWQRFEENMRELAVYAREKDTGIVVEAINFYVNNYLTTIPETAAWLERLGEDNVKLHIDTHHMNIEDDDFMAALRCGEKYLGYVHFAGANRLYPGPGRIPYGEIQQELRRIGYQGYISLECVPVPDGYTAAQRGLTYLRSI